MGEKKFDLEFQIKVMNEWALGENMTKIAEKFEISRTQLNLWKEQQVPEDWDKYREKLLHEMSSQAIARTKFKFAEIIDKQLEDSVIQRSLVKHLMNRMASQFSAKSTDGTAVGEALTLANVRMLRDLVKAQRDIQAQVSNIFQLPTHRVSFDGAKTPHAKAIGDLEIEGMDAKQLLAHLTGVLRTDGES